mgnify:FL=1
MVCQECGNNPATLHFTKIINGEKTEIHLCEECAREKGDFFSGNNGFSIQNLLSGWLNFDAGNNNAAGTQVPVQSLRCSKCGLSYAQFGKLGKFGCSECYRTFEERLDPVFRRVHGNTEHIGKIPKRAGGRVEYKRNLERLKIELQRAIEQEAFERAAELRDQIRELESKYNGD